jgi:hypothetical protein
LGLMTSRIKFMDVGQRSRTLMYRPDQLARNLLVKAWPARDIDGAGTAGIVR